MGVLNCDSSAAEAKEKAEHVPWSTGQILYCTAMFQLLADCKEVSSIP